MTIRQFKLLLNKVSYLFPLPLFVIVVVLNLIVVFTYDYIYYDKIANYKLPPLISVIYDAKTNKFGIFNTSYMTELILVASLVILLTVPKSLSPLYIIFPGLVLTLGLWAYDVEIQAHLRIPTINALTILPTFKDFLGMKAIVLGLAILLLILLSAYYLIKGFLVSIKHLILTNNLAVRLQLLLILILKLSALGVIAITPKLFFNTFYKEILWYEKEEVWTNGRLSAFYYHSLQEIDANLELSKFKYTFAQPPHTILFPDTLSHLPNIYFILLESQIDLSRLKNFSFSRFPIHPDLLKFMPDSAFSLVKSPVIGGFTAQATFEMLTGTPALHQLSPVEFLVFGTYPTSSLLRRLKEQGYFTFALVAHSKIFFNMPTAYKDLGFDSTIFLGSISPYKEYYTDRNLFVPDEDTYIYFIKLLPNLPKPLFAYIVTTYGHWPWFMPLDSDTISVFPNLDPFPALTMTTFRKQKLLAHFIDTLLTLDSNSLIVAFTDHNPPFILNDTVKVKYDAPSIYHVPILILYKGKKINIPVVPMHRVPELIYYLLANDSLPDTSSLVPLEKKHYLYKQIIKQSREGV